MKKVLFLVLAVALISVLLVLSGCNKTNPESGEPSSTPATTSNSIVGKWEYPGTTYVYEFNEDGTGSYAGSNFTYTLSGDKISILYDGMTASFDSTYSIEGNKLNIKDSLGLDTIYNRK